MESPDGEARKKRKGTTAPPARKKRKRTGAAVPSSIAPAPSVLVGPGDGAAPTARRRRTPSGAAAPPSFAPAPSVLMGPGGGVAPTARGRRKPTAGAAAPPSLRMAHGEGGDTRKREGSSLPRDRKRAKRTNFQVRSGRNVSAGGSGGGGWEGNMGSGGGVHAREGSPEAPAAPTAPLEKVAPRPHGKVSVAHTPNIPPRFEALLRNITCLIPYESKGRSYECSLDQMNTFLSWSKTEMALFFEWSDIEMEMNCWIHSIQKGEHFRFTVNAAFSHLMDDINVERAAIAFSTNFIAGEECWSALKDMLLSMFGSFEGEGLKEYDYLYVFTRVGASVYFRNFEITSFPNADDPSSGLVLTERNSSFCLKLLIDHRMPNNSAHLTKEQTPTGLNLFPVTMYSISNGEMGSCLLHSVDFNKSAYSVCLENGPYISSLAKLQGFNRSLAEIVLKEPLLKIKHIIGSVTNKTSCFVRKRCKSILRSLFGEFAMLLESGQCVTSPISMHNVLVRGTEVKLYGLHVTYYNEKQAEKNVRSLVAMIRNCFPYEESQIDLFELLKDLEKNPLELIKFAKDDCCLLKAEHRRSLLININSEFMTNVPAKSSEGSKEIDQFSFFDNCPYAENWDAIMEDNEYMIQVCNVEESSDEEADSNNQKDASVKARMNKKGKMSKNNKSIRKMTKKKKGQPNRGMLQFSSKRNFQMHMPEKARKDGLFPFRLGIADYILTAYFPRFLRFVQRRMRQVKAQREKGVPAETGEDTPKQIISDPSHMNNKTSTAVDDDDEECQILMTVPANPQELVPDE